MKRGRAMAFNTERNRVIYQRFRLGETMQEIGDAYGCTREAIRYILVKNGIDRTQGGAHVRAIARAEARVQQLRADK